LRPRRDLNSSFQGIKEVIENEACSAVYIQIAAVITGIRLTGGKVNKSNPAQFGRAMTHLGITMIAAYSPEASGSFLPIRNAYPKDLH